MAKKSKRVKNMRFSMMDGKDEMDNKWARLLAYVTGLVNQELLLQNEYLTAENRILKAHLQAGFRHDAVTGTSHPCADHKNQPRRRNIFRCGIIGSPSATPKKVKAVNSGAGFLTRRVTQMASRFHDAAKILLATSPMWTLMTAAVNRDAVGRIPCASCPYHEGARCHYETNAHTYVH